MLKLMANVKSCKLDYNNKKSGEATITLDDITLTDEQVQQVDMLTKLEDYVVVDIQLKADLFGSGKEEPAA